MGADGETHTSYVQLQEGAGGYSLGNNGLTPKGVMDFFWTTKR